MEDLDLETKAKEGIEEFKNFLSNQKELLWTEIKDDNSIIIEVEVFIDEKHILTEFLESFEFDKKGNFIS